MSKTRRVDEVCAARVLPKYLFGKWTDIASTIKASKFLCILLDFDGTLTPIVERPEMASLPSETKELLRLISNDLRCCVGVISGRTLTDVKRRVGLSNVFYAGNHGLEVEGPSMKFVYPMALKMSRTIHEMAESLESCLKDIEGVIVEDKVLTASVHYRLVPDDKIRLIERRVYKEVSRWEQVTVAKGKKVLEVKPIVNWNKGNAVKLILLSVGWKSLPIFVGDDETDEDAFQGIRDGITIAVMSRPTQTHAKYYLKDSIEVQSLLRKIAGIILQP